VQHGCHNTTRSSVPRDATHTTLRPPLAVHALAAGVVISSDWQDQTNYGDRLMCIAGNQKQQITGSRFKKLQKRIIQNRNNKSSIPPLEYFITLIQDRLFLIVILLKARTQTPRELTLSSESLTSFQASSCTTINK
jgi:hypothetical protein